VGDTGAKTPAGQTGCVAGKMPDMSSIRLRPLLVHPGDRGDTAFAVIAELGFARCCRCARCARRAGDLVLKPPVPRSCREAARLILIRSGGFGGADVLCQVRERFGSNGPLAALTESLWRRSGVGPDSAQSICNGEPAGPVAYATCGIASIHERLGYGVALRAIARPGGLSARRLT